MTFVIPSALEGRLQELAIREGCKVDALIEQALQYYLEQAAITDLTPEQIAEGQEKLFAEMTGIEPWESGPEGDAAK